MASTGRRGGMIFRVILILIVVLAVAGGVVWIFGPREPADLTVTFDPARIGADPAAYLAREEANVPNLRPNAEKEIVWAYPASRARTPLAIVYIHGFSAAKGETRPLADDVAKALGANLFYTRLTGHGRNGAAMEMASINDWVNDFAEAMAIGRRIGEKVVVIGSSTGATLATLAASQPALSQDLVGLVELSPNFALADSRAPLLTLPFARRLLPYLAEPEFAYMPGGVEVGANWTTTFPTAALLPMARLVEITRNLDFSKVRIPALFIYSPADKVVDPSRTGSIAAQWGGPHQSIEVQDSTDPGQHVLAGAIRSPATTDRLATAITNWVQALPLQ